MGINLKGADLAPYIGIFGSQISLVGGPSAAIDSIYSTGFGDAQKHRSGQSNPTYFRGPVLGSETTYANEPYNGCPPGGETLLHYYGYGYCGIYTVVDRARKPYTAKKVNFFEDLDLISSSPPNLTIIKHSAGSTKKDGTFIDTLGFGRPVVAFPTGSYALERQIYTLDPGDDSVQGRVIRVNCLDFEFTELTVTNVTSQGPNAVCKRVTH